MKALTLSLTLLLGACVEDFPSLIILGNQPMDEGSCLVDPGRDIWTGTGTLDVEPVVGYGNGGYVMTLVLQNGAKADQSGANQNIFITQGADVELLAGTTSRSVELIGDIGAATGVQRTQLFSSSIAPGEQGGGIFLGIDGDQVVAARAAMDAYESIQIIVSIKVFGTIDTNDVESNSFSFPVTLCRGCLIASIGECSLITGDVNGGGACSLFQDNRIDCCTSGGANVCPAVAPAKP